MSKQQVEIEYGLCQYVNDGDLWTITRTEKKDFTKCFSRYEAAALINQLVVADTKAGHVSKAAR